MDTSGLHDFEPELEGSVDQRGRGRGTLRANKEFRSQEGDGGQETGNRRQHRPVIYSGTAPSSLTQKGHA